MATETDKAIGRVFQVVHRLTEAQAGELVALYRNEWWTRTRQEADVRRMLAGTDLIFGLCEAGAPGAPGRLVAFARVVSDGVYKATVYDVIVAADCRGQGLGRLLMNTVLEHPAVAPVEHIELYCLPELVPFYQALSFTDELGGLRLMRLKKS
jgi:GNAT superfamily N-acetyltransferase